MSNHITIELCTEDRARLDRIIEGLEKHSALTAVAPTVASHDEAPTAEVAEATANPAEPEKAVEANSEPEQLTTPEVIEPKEAPAPKPEESKVSVADVQRKVVALSQAGKKAAVKDIVTAYGNTKVSDIPEDKLSEVMQKLTALEG